jgi:hypothetical protein
MTLFVFKEGAQRTRLYHAVPRVDIDIASFMKPGGFHSVNISHLVNIYNLRYVWNI